ncbi:MAG: hypothetical protein II457_03615 [Paludibacteraceae bacterium]|nr:hypothetical protein [Paludibacteraceae bacterium]
MEYLSELWAKYKIHGIVALIVLCVLCVVLSKCGGDRTEGHEETIVEDHLVAYPGRTFSYKDKFNDLQSKQHEVASRIGLPSAPKDREEAASMRKKLVEIKTNENYIVDDLTHSVPYLIPSAKRELDAIGAEWADILQRNGLPHYRFYVTSILRTQEDVKWLQRSGNINSTTQSCHCYGTTFDLAYMRYDKVTRTRDYMHEDNLKLVLGQVLLNHQRAGKIYVKYEWKQSCFHITVRN